MKSTLFYQRSKSAKTGRDPSRDKLSLRVPRIPVLNSHSYWTTSLIAVLCVETSATPEKWLRRGFNQRNKNKTIAPHRTLEWTVWSPKEDPLHWVVSGTWRKCKVLCLLQSAVSSYNSDLSTPGSLFGVERERCMTLWTALLKLNKHNRRWWSEDQNSIVRSLSVVMSIPQMVTISVLQPGDFGSYY